MDLYICVNKRCYILPENHSGNSTHLYVGMYVYVRLPISGWQYENSHILANTFSQPRWRVGTNTH